MWWPRPRHGFCSLPAVNPKSSLLTCFEKIILFHVLTPAPRPLWSNFRRNDSLPPNKSLLGIKIEFRLPVDKLIDLRALLTESSRKHILIYHGRDCRRIDSGPVWRRLCRGPFPGTLLIFFLTELFQQLNRSVSVIPVRSLGSVVEVIVFNILLVNAGPSGIRHFFSRGQCLILAVLLSALCLGLRFYFGSWFRCNLHGRTCLSGVGARPLGPRAHAAWPGHVASAAVPLRASFLRSQVERSHEDSLSQTRWSVQIRSCELALRGWASACTAGGVHAASDVCFLLFCFNLSQLFRASFEKLIC